MTFSIETLDLCRRLLAEHTTRHPDRWRALAEIDDALAAANGFVLASLSNGRWQIGAGAGLEHAPPAGKRGVGEVARGLALMEICIAWPGDPVEVGPFFEPGRVFDDLMESTSVMLSRTRQWVGDEVDVQLAEHLKAVVVDRGDLGPVAVYRPARFALPIATSFDP